MYSRKFPFDLNRVHTFDLNINCQPQQDFGDPTQALPLASVAIPLANWPPIHGMYGHSTLHHYQHHSQQAQQLQQQQQLEETAPFLNPMVTDGIWLQQHQQQGSRGSSLLSNWQDMVFQGTMLVAHKGQQTMPAMEATVATAEHVQKKPPRQQPFLLPRSANPANAPPPGPTPCANPSTIATHSVQAIRSEAPQSPTHIPNPCSALVAPILTDTQIESPDWLPDGWITELHIRQTGTTAGTRDKYYKDLLSGRRFRSRNEVLRFLETGKGRVRRRHRSTKLICDVAVDSSSGGGLNNPRLADDVPSSYKQQNLVVATTKQPAIMIGLKRITPQGSPQKLLNKKKPRTLSPKDSGDKHTSRLWQWLQKPVAKSSEPQVSEKLELNKDSVCKELPKRSDRDIVEGLQRGIHAAQRLVRLGRDVQAAERNALQLSREMQAIVENLGLEIRAGQRAMESRNETAFSNHMKSETENEAAKQASDAFSNVAQAAEMINAAMGNVMQAAERIDGTMGNIIQASQKLDTAIGNMIQVSQMYHPTSVTNTDLIPYVENEINKKQNSESILKLKIQGATQPIFAMDDGLQETEGPYLLDTNFYRTAETINTSFTCKATQASSVPILAMGHVSQTGLMPLCNAGSVVTHIHPTNVLPFTPAAVMQPLHISVKPMSNLIPNASSGTLVNIKDTTKMNSEKLAPAAQIPIEPNKQIVEVRSRHGSKLPSFSPKFDLTRICVNMTRRQRARLVQTMKARHTRGLLAAVGRRLCYVALERESSSKVLSCKPYCLAGIRNRNLSRNDKPDDSDEVAWVQETALYFESHDTLKETQPEIDQLSDNEGITDEEIEEIQSQVLRVTGT